MSPSSILFALVTVVLNGGAQLLLRKAALGGAAPSNPLSLLRSGWFVAGIGAYGLSVLTWLVVLRKVPLSIAAPFVALVYVLVPLASRAVFDDVLTARMWLGMTLVVVGVSLVATGAPDRARAADPSAVKKTG